MRRVPCGWARRIYGGDRAARTAHYRTKNGCAQGGEERPKHACIFLDVLEIWTQIAALAEVLMMVGRLDGEKVAHLLVAT